MESWKRTSEGSGERLKAEKSVKDKVDKLKQNLYVQFGQATSL